MQLSIEIKEIKLRITLETYKTIKIKVFHIPLLQKVCYIMLISKSYMQNTFYRVCLSTACQSLSQSYLSIKTVARFVARV